MAKAKKLPSGNWRVLAFAGKDNEGNRQYKSFTASTKKEAEYMAAEFIMNQKAQDKSNMTIKKAVEEYIASKEHVLSPSTIKGYNNILNKKLSLIAEIPIDDFSSVEAQNYINALAVENSPKTVRNAWGLVVSSITMQTPEKRLFATLPAPKKRFQELPMAKDVIQAVKGTNVELPALLAMWLSLRMSEVRGLKYSDIKGDIITVQRAKLIVQREEIVREQTKHTKAPGAYKYHHIY